MSLHSDTEFRLPLEVRPLADARIAVRDYYRRKGLRLEFSFDGNLVGDFGEACAVEEYGMKLVEAKNPVQIPIRPRPGMNLSFVI